MLKGESPVRKCVQFASDKELHRIGYKDEGSSDYQYKDGYFEESDRGFGSELEDEVHRDEKIET